jgi:hypothetical protein
MLASDGSQRSTAHAEDTSYAIIQQTAPRLRLKRFWIKFVELKDRSNHPSQQYAGGHSPGESMSGNMLVYEPVAPCLTEARESRQALDNLAGKVIGFIDNSKPNFSLLVDDLAQILIEKHGVKSVVKRRKKSASQGAPEAVMNDLVSQVDAVITGSGD